LKAKSRKESESLAETDKKDLRRENKEFYLTAGNTEFLDADLHGFILLIFYLRQIELPKRNYCILLCQINNEGERNGAHSFRKGF